jgi:biopolymer transport protein TolR
MSMEVGGNRLGLRSEINVTPLVDVVLVLLIIFMVITPMLQRGKAVELPKAVHAGKGPPGEPKFVSITKDGKTYFESDQMNLDQLQEQMRLTNADGVRIMLKADQDTEYRFIRPVLDRASKAKMKGIALAAEQLKVR